MQVAHFDCFSGISGDMTLAALIDAGVDADTIRRGIESLGLPITLEVEVGELGWADKIAIVPGVERIDGRVVRYSASDMPTIYRMARVILMLARN